MADSIRVIAQITALPGKEAGLKKALVDVVEPSRAEAGCLCYELMQSHLVPTQFATWEEWSSEAAMNEHLASDHIQRSLIEAEPFLQEPPSIVRYNLIS
jgi:quinol monooxygenase YgiN